MEKASIKQREICLIPFPFSDQSGKKVRPVVVISNDRFNVSSQDVIVVGVTSNIYKDLYSISISNDDLEEGKLLCKCCIKVENILKIDKKLILKKIGKLKKKKFEEVIKILDSILG